MDVFISVPEKLYQEIVGLSKENVRSVGQEVLYRLEQGVRMRKHLSDSDEGLLKVIAKLYDREDYPYEQ